MTRIHMANRVAEVAVSAKEMAMTSARVSSRFALPWSARATSDQTANCHRNPVNCDITGKNLFIETNAAVGTSARSDVATLLFFVFWTAAQLAVWEQFTIRPTSNNSFGHHGIRLNAKSASPLIFTCPHPNEAVSTEVFHVADVHEQLALCRHSTGDVRCNKLKTTLTAGRLRASDLPPNVCSPTIMTLLMSSSDKQSRLTKGVELDGGERG